MKTLTKNAFLALAVSALLSACSRPYATFQQSQREQFTQQAQPSAVTPVVDVAQPTEATTPVAVAEVATPATPVATPAVAASSKTVREALDKYEAVALADNKLTDAQKTKVAKRMEQARTMLTAMEQRGTDLNATATTHKASVAERMLTKKIDKQIQKKLAPNSPKATANSLLRVGIIVGLIGLILLLVGNGVGATIGYLALIAGIVLVILGLIG